MRLTLKFTVAFLLSLIPVLGVYAYVLWQRETRLFLTDMMHDDLQIGKVFAPALGQTSRYGGLADAFDLLQRANESEGQVRLRWVWVDAPAAEPDGPHLPDAEREGLAQGRIVTRIDQAKHGPGSYLTYVPIGDEAGRPAALEVAESLSDQQHQVRQSFVHLAVTTGVIAAVSSLLAILLGFWLVARPIRRLIDCTGRVAAGDFSGLSERHQRDELGQLATALNHMCQELASAHARVAAETSARIAALEQLRHADRLRTVGQLTSGIAHELGTPLNVVWARASMIASGEVAGRETQDNARVITEQSARMTKIIRQLLDFSRPRSPKKATADLYAVVRRTFGLLETIARRRGVTLALADDGATLPLEVDADQLQQVLSNLVLNAIQAMPDGGPITVRIERRRARHPAEGNGPAGKYVCVSVADRGQGIAPENIPHVFEPFFSTKGMGEGTGLGLSVSMGIIREHGGWIDVESEPGQGTCFRIYLPEGAGSCAAAS